MPISITAFYKFLPLAPDALSSLREALQMFGKENDMRGLVLLAEEGINGTVCGSESVIAAWKDLLTQHFGEIVFKDSEAEAHVYPRWFVKIRDEVVTLKNSEVKPSGEKNHLTPEEWDAMMEEDVVVLDTRNDYETEVGIFKNAVDPKLKHFKEFPNYVKNSDIPKNKTVLMYCTGGIRCEKAQIEMEKQGYKHVYQLKGGILAYLEKFPHKKFEGECFVFDHRVSVDQELKPSARYKLCPHCGDPGDREISCSYCANAGVICYRCEEEESKKTCSKDCRHRLLYRAHHKNPHRVR